MRGTSSAQTYSRIPIDGVQCPFCLNEAGYVLYQVTSAEAATHFIEVTRDAPDSHVVADARAGVLSGRPT